MAFKSPATESLTASVDYQRCCVSMTSFVCSLEFRKNKSIVTTRRCCRKYFLEREISRSRVFWITFRKHSTYYPVRHVQSIVRSCAETYAVPKDNTKWRTHPLRIIIAGAPASGKGTQCKKIAERYGVVHLSTGDMLREAIQNGTELGKIAKEFMDTGRLVGRHVDIFCSISNISFAGSGRVGY